jgi:integrase
MPDGAAVIKYEGKRGVVWRVKYRDADGRQVQETLGRTSDGWSRRKAEAELRARLTDVRRTGLRKLEPVTFKSFAQEWVATYPAAKGLKRSTREGYKAIVDLHLEPAFGQLRLEEIDVGRIDAYMATKRKGSKDKPALAPRTVNRHLNLLHQLLEAAVRRGLVRSNPVSAADRPREPRRRWTILSPAEVVRVERAFGDLVDEAEEKPELVWREQARVVFLASMATGLRRGELLGLRWRNVLLADPDGPTLRVAETWVRGQEDTPKSEAGERTIALGKRLADELFAHRGRSSFAGDDERVFCHPETGGVLDYKRYAKTLRLALAKAEVDRPMRPFHDGRHTSITNAAAAGTSPAALMARAGHSDFATTQLYIDLSGEAFREEADMLERRLWGETGTRNRYKEGSSSPEPATAESG